MDPNACLDLIISDPSERTCAGAVGDMREWLSKDGFAPDLRDPARYDAFRRWVYSPQVLIRTCVGTPYGQPYCPGCGLAPHDQFHSPAYPA